MFGMFIHAFLEGIPLANITEISSPYLLGIVFHNLPISFILGAFFIGAKNAPKLLGLLFLFLLWHHHSECFG